MSNKSRYACRSARTKTRASSCWKLRVYVVDAETRSAVTVANLEGLCRKYVPGKYRIQIVDLLKTPQRCSRDQILAVPTVVRCFPLPERRAIGTLADAGLAAAALELEPVN